MKTGLKYTVIGALLIIAQGALDNYVNLSVYVDIALFLFIILMLPYRLGTVPAMLTAFAIGLVVDILGNGIPGLTSSALTAAALCRKGMLAVTVPKDASSKDGHIQMESIGIRRFILYSVPLILVYLTVYILVDNAGFRAAGMFFLRLTASLAVNTAVMAALFAVSIDNRRK